MITMVKYEWKKLWQGRLAQFAILLCFAVFMYSVVSNVAGTSAAREDGTVVSGIEAIKLLQERGEVVDLDQRETDRIMEEYIGLTQNPETSSNDPAYEFLSEETYRKYYINNRDMLKAIASVYNLERTNMPMREVFQQSLGKSFQKARNQRDLINIAEIKSQGLITDQQAEYWNEAVGKIQEPISFGYCEGWKQIYFSLTWSVLIMMVVAIGVAPLFSGEYQTKCDSILLCMRNGKSKLVTAKLIAAYLYTTFVFLLLNAANIIPSLLVFGSQGGNLPIQAIVPEATVGYVFTVRQGVLLTFILAYIYTLCYMGFVLLLSSVMQNSYGVVVISVPLAIILTILSPDFGGYLWRHVVSLLPPQIMTFSFWSFTAYTVLGKVVPLLFFGMLVNGFLTVVFTFVAQRKFRLHEVNK